MNAFAQVDRKKRLVRCLRKWWQGLGLEGDALEAELVAIAGEVARGKATVENWIKGVSAPTAPVLDALEAALSKRGRLE